MRIGVIGSMEFSEQLVEARNRLINMGHEAFITGLHRPFLGKSRDEKLAIKRKQRAETDSIREFWDMMQGADAVLVLNIEKNGIPNYVGANTLIEIGFAHVLGQRIFFLNPLPDMPYCREELEATHPVVINGDFSKIKQAGQRGP